MRAVAWSPDGTRLATAGTDGCTPVWDPTTGRPRHPHRPHQSGAAVAWSPDGTRLATASVDADADLGSRHRRTLTTLAGHTGPVTAVAWSPDGTRLATATGYIAFRL